MNGRGRVLLPVPLQLQQAGYGWVALVTDPHPTCWPSNKVAEIRWQDDDGGLFVADRARVPSVTPLAVAAALSAVPDGGGSDADPRDLWGRAAGGTRPTSTQFAYAVVLRHPPSRVHPSERLFLATGCLRPLPEPPPATAARRARNPAARITREELRAEVEHFRGSGMTYTEVAQRLGVLPESLTRRLQRVALHEQPTAA